MDFELNLLNWTHNYFQSEALTIWTLILTDKNNLLWPGVATIVAFLYLKKKQGLLFILTATLTILLADGISENILKPLIARSRPCTTLDFIRNADNFFLNSVHCSPSFSFPSSQAVNLFTLATLWVGFFWEERLGGLSSRDLGGVDPYLFGAPLPVGYPWRHVYWSGSGGFGIEAEPSWVFLFKGGRRLRHPYFNPLFFVIMFFFARNRHHRTAQK